jgi:hypothetical protein
MLTVNQQGTYIMEEKSKNIFYLDPDYENFVLGKTKLKDNTGMGCCLVILLVPIIPPIGFSVFGFIRDANASMVNWSDLLIEGIFLFFYLLFLIFCIAIIIAIFKAEHTHQLLQREGIILSGTVVEAKYEYQLPRPGYGAYYLFDITVEFETPDGHQLTRKFSKREYAIGREAPASGTPVKLLYANDRAVIML